MTYRAVCVFLLRPRCVFCFVISRIIASCLVVGMKLPVLRRKMFIALYHGLLLIVAGLLHHAAKVSVLAFCRLARFSGFFWA